MKKLLVLQGPVTSRSGYGDHTRDILKSIISLEKFDVKVIDMRWGDCPQNGLSTDEEYLTGYFINPQKGLPKRPDVFVQISVPNEFNPIGVYNIGITAGMETTAVSAPWIDGSNRMDLIIVPSEHSKNTLLNSVYDKHDKNTKEKVGELKVIKPVEVLFEGANTDIFFKTNDESELLREQMSVVKENFCFLYVGHWLQGSPGHERKDIAGLIKTFCQTFKSNPSSTRPALILKTSGATFSVIDREHCLSKIREIKQQFGDNCPTVYLLHGDMAPEELNQLYNHSKVKVHVSFTHGEGYGRPLLEASLSGKPVIAPNWSGHIDFLSAHSILLPGDLRKVHPSAVWKDVIIPESSWYYVNYGYASKIFKQVFKKYKDFLPNAKKQSKLSREQFSLTKMQDEFMKIFNEKVKLTEEVKISLPQLNAAKKITLPKLTAVK